MTKIPNPEQAQQEKDDRQGGSGGDGEVSEVSTMADPGSPIQPDQSVAGSPDDEAGGVEEGAQGPNANPNAGARKT